MLGDFLELRRKYGARAAIQRRVQLWKNRYMSPSTEKTILSDLQRIGIQLGDLVLVHSAFSKIGYLQGGPSAFIAALKTAVGPDGSIMMPAFPYLGGSYEYACRNELFDVLNTPAGVGRLQEMFRTMPGTLRSLHPTHSYCVWGKRASEIVSNHHLSMRPFGPGTPLHRFIEMGGKTLLVGVDLKNFSPPRAIEDVMDYPYPVYVPETFKLRVRDYRGAEFIVETYVHSHDLAPLRNTHVFYEPLKSRGKIQEGKVGLAKAMYIDCAGLLDHLRELTNRGITPYSHLGQLAKTPPNEAHTAS
jgi:aminoglycoside 3-N-acetyltransferase